MGSLWYIKKYFLVQIINNAHFHGHIIRRDTALAVALAISFDIFEDISGRPSRQRCIGSFSTAFKFIRESEDDNENEDAALA